jgi:hypothetical protein
VSQRFQIHFSPDEKSGRWIYI